jgi:hypothetical protein
VVESNCIETSRRVLELLNVVLVTASAYVPIWAGTSSRSICEDMGVIGGVGAIEQTG